ncbi:uncharacterized protein LTR77_010906 [Saxophila tyrrhenica]|uniref:Uncharacterized protein n=1 Tax=Saxophila tyrrhenica TaxID=1690608 RepID=A0AAV9NU95_9PEZI|nr:hypothetical protein LTR77_010906 [Saxophila tyrrhenica]
MSYSDNDRREYTCPTVPGQHTEYARGSEYNLIFAVTIGCMALTLLISLILILQHFRRYRVPKEQRQIVKIVFTPVVFSIIAVAAMSDYYIAPYVVPLAELYAAFSLAALFLLYMQFAAPGANFGKDMFAALVMATVKNRKRDRADWPMGTWIAVFQLPVAEAVAYTIESVTEARGTFCASSMRPRFGNF